MSEELWEEKQLGKVGYGEGYLDRVDVLLIRMTALVEHICELCKKVGGGTTDNGVVMKEEDWGLDPDISTEII